MRENLLPEFHQAGGSLLKEAGREKSLLAIGQIL